jgi:hypothetical protein
LNGKIVLSKSSGGQIVGHPDFGKPFLEKVMGKGG